MRIQRTDLMVAASLLGVAAAPACAGAQPAPAEGELAAVPPELIAEVQRNPRPPETSEPPAVAPDAAAKPPVSPAETDAGADAGAASVSPLDAAPPVAPSGGTGTLSGKVVAKGGGSPKFTYVFLENPPAGGKAVHGWVNQQNMRYSPYATVVTQGAKVTFGNSDPFPHNVFSPDNERFDLGTFGKGGARQRVFKRPGVYRIQCNLHPSMLAFVLVVPSAYYAEVKKSGEFSIADVPYGTYEVSAWGPQLKKATQSVAVSAADTNISFELEKGKP